MIVVVEPGVAIKWFVEEPLRPQARSLLVAQPRDVAGVGHLVGYDSPSQFTREYRRLFGAPPAQDAARLRTESEPAATFI